MKAGTVALFGRPNVGKSTLVNSLVGQKVAITSPKPQTTRFPIHALYNDDRAQIVFIDTPGIFDKAHDTLAKKINKQVLAAVETNFDIALYIVDPTRKRDFEEGKVLGIMRKINKPKILVINKMDQTDEGYLAQYKFLEDEFEYVFYISALERKHLTPLLDTIIELLPEGVPVIEKNEYVYPVLNLDSKTFLAEIIREKVFLKMRKELPYTTTVVIDEITERNDKLTYIKARILTTDDKYKKMIIGERARRIKEIGTMARKEIALATSRKIFLDLTVETDKHWVQTIG